MKPKLAAATITGTMARPSRPSVRFTALPKPTMMKAAKTTKKKDEVEQEILEEREGERGREGRRAGEIADADRRPMPANRASMVEAQPAGKALVGLLGDLEIVVVEADRAEAER